MGWTLLQAMINDALQTGRHIAAGFGKLRRVFLQNRAHGVSRSFSMKCAFAREHLVKNRAECEEIRAVVGGFASHLFRRHVADRAHHNPGIGCDLHGRSLAGSRSFLRVNQLRKSEIQNLHPAVVGDEKIFGLQVTMDDALIVRGSQSTRDLHCIVNRLADA